MALINSNSGGDMVAILMGNGDGPFQPPVAYGLDTYRRRGRNR